MFNESIDADVVTQAAETLMEGSGICDLELKVSHGVITTLKYAAA